MKKIIVIIFLFLFFSINGFTQFAWIEQQTGYSFLQTPTCVKFFDAQTGILVGRYSVFSRTTNSGINWMRINNYAYNHYNSISFINSSTGWIAGDSNGVEIIKKTTNAGLTWDSLYFETGSSVRDIQFTDSQTGFFVGNHYIKKTTNSGNSWNVVYDMGINFTNYSLFFLNSLTGWVTSTSYNPYTTIFTTKLIKTNNGGQNWVILILDSSYSNITCNDIQFISENTGYISRTSLGIYKTTTSGQNWSNVQNSSSYNIFFINENTGWVGSEYYIRRTTNGGVNWNSESVIQRVFFSSICFVNDLTGWAVGSTDQSMPKIFKTTNGGVSINFSISGFARYSDNNQPITSGWVKAIKLDKGTGGIIIADSAAIQSDGSYMLTKVPQDSVDIGIYPNSTPPNDWVITYYPSTTYWEKATTLYPTGNLTNINIGAIRMNAATNNNSVNGKVMRLTNSPLGNLKDAVLYAKNGNTFVRCVMSDGNGVYHLNSLPAGSLKIVVNRLGFTSDSTTVNVTSASNTDSINFYLNRVYVGVKKIGENLPSEYKLYQNYPNPFNPATIIRYSIPNDGFRTGAFRNDKTVLKVYDILGKEVVTLVNEEQKPGVYEVMFDASGLPSGIYFYRFETQSYKETKKMVLMK